MLILFTDVLKFMQEKTGEYRIFVTCSGGVAVTDHSVFIFGR